MCGRNSYCGVEFELGFKAAARPRRLCHNAPFAPSGLAHGSRFTHGLRRGLYSRAASRLLRARYSHFLIASQGCVKVPPYTSVRTTFPKFFRSISNL